MMNQKNHGLRRLLDFVEILRSEKIDFLVYSKTEASLCVDFSLLGVPVEVTFDADGVDVTRIERTGDAFAERKVHDVLLTRFGLVAVQERAAGQAKSAKGQSVEELRWMRACFRSGLSTI